MSVFPSYRNQSIELHSKSIDRFLYGGNAGILWVNVKYYVLNPLNASVALIKKPVNWSIQWFLYESTLAFNGLRKNELKSLTLTVPITDEERKLTWIFILTLLYGASKGFIKALEALIKLFQRQKKCKNKM